MSTTVMHTIKENLYPGDTHVDAEYETALLRYTQLDQQTRAIKEAASKYSNSHYIALANAHIVSHSFAAALDDPLSETGFETLSKQMLSAHAQLDADRQSALTARMSEQVLVPLEKLHLHLLELSTKKTKRDELHKNLQYYLRKVGQLVRDREERGAKGKVESDSHKDKLTRNQLKLDTVRQQYTQYTQPLIMELSAVWNTRANYLGPVLASFAAAEKEFVRVYSAALDEVHMSVVESAQAKRMTNLIPAVQGSSLVAPHGTDVAPNHTMHVGTVNASQAMLVAKAQDPSAINVSSTAGLARVENTIGSHNASTIQSTNSNNSSTVAPMLNDSLQISANGTSSAPLGASAGEIQPLAHPSKKTQEAAVVNAAQSEVTMPGVIVTEQQAHKAITDKQQEEKDRVERAERAERERVERERQLLQTSTQSTPAAVPTLIPTTATTTTAAPLPVAVSSTTTTTTSTAKPLFEDESKLQRFEQEHKTAQIL